jgi:hypothetical protein
VSILTFGNPRNDFDHSVTPFVSAQSQQLTCFLQQEQESDAILNGACYGVNVNTQFKPRDLLADLVYWIERTIK